MKINQNDLEQKVKALNTISHGVKFDLDFANGGVRLVRMYEGVSSYVSVRGTKREIYHTIEAMINVLYFINKQLDK